MEEEIRKITLFSSEELIRYVMQLRLIKDNQTCDHFSMPMKLTKTKDCIDGYNFRCLYYSCTKYQSTKTIRTNSKFKGIAICFRKILKIVRYWALGFFSNEILRLVTVSAPTLLKLRRLIISNIEHFYSNEPIRLGGLGAVVQIDETMVNFKVKSHRGRGPRQQIWALVIVDCFVTPAAGFCTIVPNRKAETLIPIINNVVREGSIIHTDEFRSYLGLRVDERYTLRQVCHKYNFVCQQTGVHTQNVESYNNSLKLAIKRCKGVKSNDHHYFLLEFMWRNEKNVDVFEKTIEVLKIY